MINAIWSWSVQIIQGVVTKEDGKENIEKEVLLFDEFLTDADQAYFDVNVDDMLKVTMCARYNLTDRDAIVAFSISEVPENYKIIFYIPSSPMDNNTNDTVNLPYLPVSYLPTIEN